MTIPIKSPCEESAALATPSALQPCRGPWVLIVSILASSMAFIDGTAVNVALPALQTALHATVQDMQWVVEAYALLLASLLLLGGSLGDLYGRRRGLRLGCAAVCSGIGLVRLCSFDRLPHLRARPARHRRGIPRARKSGHQLLYHYYSTHYHRPSSHTTTSIDHVVVVAPPTGEVLLCWHIVRFQK